MAFDRYRSHLRFWRARYGFDPSVQPSGGEPGCYLTAAQLLELAWRVVGATLAALGIPREELSRIGKLVEPTIEDLVRGYVSVSTEQ